MTSPTVATLGTVGHEADASIRGYNYQAYVAAIEWCLLGPDEELHLEIAEDVAVIGPDGAKVVQVKDVSRRLTLRSAHDFLDRVVDRLESARGQARFHYLTTAPFGADPGWPGGARQPFLAVWNGASGGNESPEEVVAYLRRVARPESALNRWLTLHDDKAVVTELLPAVRWEADAPTLVNQQQRLEEEVAAFCALEFGLERFKGRQLSRIVANRVKELSAAPDIAKRTLSRRDLHHLLLPHAKVSLEPREYADMARAAKLARQVPVDLLTQELVTRLDALKAGRFFPELRMVDAARELARDATDEGGYALAAPAVRSEVAAWCARLLVHEDTEAAVSLLTTSEAIAKVPQQRLVKALIEAETSVPAAIRTLLNVGSAEALTAQFLVRRRRSQVEATAWLAEDGLAPSDFDNDGKFIILIDALQRFDWAFAFQWLERIESPEKSEHPALLWATALTNYCIALPEYLREWAFDLRPTVIDEDLRTTPDAGAAKLMATELFDAFEAQCRARGWWFRADLALEYALWLKLQSPDTRFAAQKRAEDFIQGDLLPSSARQPTFRWVPLALAAGQGVDAVALLKRIKSFAQFYGLDEDGKWALFALVQYLPPDVVLDEWTFILESLRDLVNPVQLASIRVQVLARTGARAEARHALAEAHLPEEIAVQLEALYLSDELALDSIKVTSPSARRQLAHRQKTAGDSRRAIATLEQVYSETSALADACLLVRLLLDDGALERARGILDCLDPGLESDARVSRLRLRLALLLGNWQQALAELTRAQLDPPDTLHQRIEIAIQSMDWDALPELLQQATSHEVADAAGLLQIATVANTLGFFGLAQSNAEAAVKVANGDPSTLMSAYLLAVRGNWVDKYNAGDWLLHAIAKNDASPEEKQVLKRKSLQELVDLAPRFNERSKSLLEMVQSAELFLAMAADANNEPLMAVVCQPMWRNTATPDAAARRVVPLFAGTKREVQIPDGAQAALDATAVLVLGYLDLLDALPNVFQKVYLPHDFGLWLLNERERSRFHQPSRVAQANDLIRWVVRRDIEVVPPKVRRGRLYREVGRELADLIDARRADGSSRGAFVVHPYPIYNVGSSMTRLAELPAETVASIVSVRGVVAALDRLGFLKADEVDRTAAFLGNNDNGWPAEPAIPPGANLYLDGLALAYLHALGLVDRCIAARFRLKIHDDVSRDAVALSSYEDESAYPQELVEKIQKFANAGIRSGFVQSLAKPRRDPEDDDDRLATRLLKQNFVGIPKGAILVIDDRAGNRYQSMTTAAGIDHTVVNSLDVLDRLHGLEILSQQEIFAKRALLRESGCGLIPVLPEEARHAAEDLTIVDGEAREGYFARTLRESIQLLRVSRYVALPLEEHWLINTASVFREAVTTLWDATERTDDDERADWLFNLGRFSAFSASFVGDFDARRGLMQEALEVARYLVDLTQEREGAYWAWVDERLCKPLKDERPAAFNLLIETLKHQLLRIKNEDSLHQGGVSEPVEAISRDHLASIAAACLSAMPKTVKAPLLEDEEFCKELGISVNRQTTAHTASRPTFKTDALYAAVRELLKDGAAASDALDHEGRAWTMERTDDGVVARLPGSSEAFDIAFAPLFADDQDQREQHLSQLVAEVGADAHLEQRWRKRLIDHPMDVSEVAALRRELRASPLVVRSTLNDALHGNPVLPQQLVPDVEVYFLAIAGLTPEQAVLPSEHEALAPWGSTVAIEEQLRLSLYRCIHSRFAPVALVDAAAFRSLQEWIEAWSPTLDAWSLVGFIEALCRSSRADDEVAALLRTLLQLANEVLMPDSPRMNTAATLAAFVDQRVALSGSLATLAPSARRLASFAHAAVLESQLLEAHLDLASFSEWLEQFQTPFHAVSLADVNLEPRWSGVLLSPAQLAYELTGRVATAIRGRSGLADSPELEDALGDPKGVMSRHHLVYGGLPGPLEGATNLEQPLPEQLQDQLRESLDAPGTNLADSLRVAAHIGMLGRLAPDVIARINDRLTTLIDSDEDLLGAADGGQTYVMLCHVAASLRDTEMASLLSRVVADDVSISIGLRVYLRFLCCGAHLERAAWAKALDALVWELSQNDGGPESRHGHYILQTIAAVRTDIVPLVQRRLASYRE